MTGPARSYELVVLKGDFAVSRLRADAPVPSWADRGSFSSVSRTAAELSIVCGQEHVPEGVRAEKGLSCLEVVGPFAFSEVGVLASLSTALAAAGISLFAISTFDTDYLLVRQLELPDAIDALREGGHTVHF